MKFAIKIIMAAMFSMLVGTVVSGATGFDPYATSGVLFLTSFIPTGLSAAGILPMAVNVEIWEKDIEKVLIDKNPWLDDVHAEDQHVLNGSVVHIPQSAGGTNVEKNRQNLPAGVRKRSDTDVTYVLDEYTTDPVLIPEADKHELSYDKRDSVIGEDKEFLANAVAEEALYIFADGLPATSIVLTEGVAKAATAEGATGTRKGATRDDLQKMRSKLFKQKKWVEGQMYALIPSDMLAQMFPANDVITATYAANLTEEERREGVVYKASGFKIRERGSVLRYAADGTLKGFESLGEATDNEAAIFWEKRSLARAKGTIKMFQKEDDPQYYGNIYSFLVRFGGRRRRADNKGVVVLRQA